MKFGFIRLEDVCNEDQVILMPLNQYQYYKNLPVIENHQISLIICDHIDIAVFGRITTLEEVIKFNPDCTYNEIDLHDLVFSKCSVFCVASMFGVHLDFLKEA